jgi:hypothetical protein
MKMRTLRRLKTQAPRHLRRRSLDASDTAIEAQPDPSPEAVFDRVTGPYGRRPGSGSFDEET